MADRMAEQSEAGRQDPHGWVVVPADDDTQGRQALADSETLSPESLEEELEGAPPNLEELVHETDTVGEALRDEGQPLEALDEEEVEAAIADLADQEQADQEAAGAG